MLDKAFEIYDGRNRDNSHDTVLERKFYSDPERPLWFRIDNTLGLGLLEVEEEERAYLSALTLAQAIVLDPRILDTSECAHRAVVACLVSQLPEDINIHDLNVFLRLHKLPVFTVIVGGVPFLYSIGVNSWHSKAEQGRQTLYCKTEVGAPWEVSEDALPWIAQQTTLRLEDVDQACPKRTQNIDCNVDHAEIVAIRNSNLVHKAMEIPWLDTFITCTWTPCTNCLRVLEGNQEVLHDVFHIFSAHGDEQDIQNSRAIRNIFNRTPRLNLVHGPYFTVQKTPGYGWAARKSTDLIRDVLENNAGRGAAEAPYIYKLLSSALGIIEQNPFCF